MGNGAFRSGAISGIFFFFLPTPKHRTDHLDEYIQVEKDEIIITLVLAKYEQPFEARRGHKTQSTENKKPKTLENEQPGQNKATKNSEIRVAMKDEAAEYRRCVAITQNH